VPSWASHQLQSVQWLHLYTPFSGPPLVVPNPIWFLLQDLLCCGHWITHQRVCLPRWFLLYKQINHRSTNKWFKFLCLPPGFPVLQSWWLPVPFMAYHHWAKSNYAFKLYACNVQSYITTVGILSCSACFGHAMSMSSRSVMQGHISTQSSLTISFVVCVANCGWPCHCHTDTEQQWHCFHVLPQYCDCDAVLANICFLGAEIFIHVGNRQWPCSWAGFPFQGCAHCLTAVITNKIYFDFECSWVMLNAVADRLPTVAPWRALNKKPTK
jgi:hypothetical protein